MKSQLLFHSSPSRLTYIAQKTVHSLSSFHLLWSSQGSVVQHEFGHLACFVPGMLAIDGIPGHIELARDLMSPFPLFSSLISRRTCVALYEWSPTGLPPEIAKFVDGEDFVYFEPNYILRPGMNSCSLFHGSLTIAETVESLFILYRVTGDEEYREIGWKIFTSMTRHCVTDHGFSGIFDVTYLSFLLPCLMFLSLFVVTLTNPAIPSSSFYSPLLISFLIALPQFHSCLSLSPPSAPSSPFEVNFR